MVREHDFYLADVTIEELDTTSTGDSVRMPLEKSDVDHVLRPYAGDLRADPSWVKTLLAPRRSLPVRIGILTRIIRSHGEAVMIEVTSVFIDKTDMIKGRLPEFCIGENKVRRGIVWYANSACSKKEHLFPDPPDDDEKEYA